MLAYPYHHVYIILIYYFHIIMYSNEKKFSACFMVCVLICVPFFICCSAGQSLEHHPSTYSIPLFKNPEIIIIPDDYPTIQEGINHAHPGDRVFVRQGIYTEHIVIWTENVGLRGENKSSTIIDGENTSFDAVTITADGVTVEGFTIRNARFKDNLIWNQSGIVIHSSNVTVKNTIIKDNHLGILSYITALNLTICDNMFYYDGFLPGCYLQYIDGQYQGADTIPLASVILNVTNNTVNGKPLYYMQNTQDMVVETDAGQVILVNCTNITVKDLILERLDFSVLLYYCKDCLVENITINDSDGELILFFSENNTIQNNHIRNAIQGICFDLGAKNNRACNNDVSECKQGITLLSACSDNTVQGNSIDRCTWGLEISSLTKNAPSHDNLISGNILKRNNIGIILSTSFQNPLCFTYNNTLENNTISGNIIGIDLRSSEGNIMKNNIFKRNLLSASFMDCSQNFWLNNYWNRPRMAPKPILGFRHFGILPVPWLNFDMHPAMSY